MVPADTGNEFSNYNRLSTASVPTGTPRPYIHNEMSIIDISIEVSNSISIRNSGAGNRIYNILSSAKSGPGTAYYLHAHVHNILSNVRSDIRKYVVSWLKHSGESTKPVPGPILEKDTHIARALITDYRAYEAMRS